MSGTLGTAARRELAQRGAYFAIYMLGAFAFAALVFVLDNGSPLRMLTVIIPIILIPAAAAHAVQIHRLIQRKRDPR